MGEIIVRKTRGWNWKVKISPVLIFILVFGTLMYLDFGGRAEAAVGDNLLHNSANLGNQGWPTGWGVAGGRYGAFTCETCHTKTTTNIKRIKTAITAPNGTDTWPNGSTTTGTITFTKADAANNLSDMGATATPWAGICNVCHDPTKHSHYAYNASDGVHNVGLDCGRCHLHSNAFQGAGKCTDCHNTTQSGTAITRQAIVPLFSANSHHVQGVTLDSSHCYACHWEANSDGSVNSTYHPYADAPIELVVWGTSTTRPTTHTTGTTAVTYDSTLQTRTELQKINQVCLGCHNDANLNTTPFSSATPAYNDTSKTSKYAWDASSIDARYSQTGTTTWGKFSSTTYTNVSPKDQQMKAYSAHGRADLNERGWDTNETWPNTSGGNVATGAVVLCIDCHNAHGSTVAGTTTSYTSATTNGGLLKDVTSGRDSAVTYKAISGGGIAGHNVYNAGAGICFDCHENSAGTVLGNGTTPWGYDTYGGTVPVRGYFDKPYWDGTSAVKNGAETRFALKNTLSIAGGHFGASSTLQEPGAPATSTIGGLCTPCHDPHGVTSNIAKIAAADKVYAVPLLKGTWITSPYKEDAPPADNGRYRVGGRSGQSSGGYNYFSMPTYNIDQNTFTSTKRTVVSWGNPNPITQTTTQFAGLCLQCHLQTNIHPNTTGAWKSYARVHNTVEGWGGQGANAANAMHSYVCSKCHTTHNTCLPRLAITNCLDWKHRGMRVSGGTAGTHVGSGNSGVGQGRFPGGGGGNGRQPALGQGFTKYLFGTAGANSSTRPNIPACHDRTTAGGTTWPGAELWNSKTPW